MKLQPKIFAQLLVLMGMLGFMVLTGMAQVHPEHRPSPTPGDASTLHWVVTIGVVIALLAFIFWALYAKLRHGKHTNLGYHALGGLVIVMTLFTLVLYLIPATNSAQIQPTDRAWDWKPSEQLSDPGGSGLAGEPYRGYLIYLANGCSYCHTLYLRPQDIETGWGEGARPEEISEIGDYVHYPFTMLGTQRDGPDLTIIGRKIPDMSYQIEHLVNPRKFKERSIMPSYRYLSEQELKDLAAFLVTLGNKPSALRTGQVSQPQPSAELSDLAKQGQELYRKLGCVACHSTDGSSNVGPTWKGLYGTARDVLLEDGSSATVTADDQYLSESMTHPAAKVVKGYKNFMTSIQTLAGGREVSQTELQAIIEFIKSLEVR